MNTTSSFRRHNADRRVTQASVKTDRHLANFVQQDASTSQNGLGPSRVQALQVAKRYASAIGLKAAKIAVIDQLFAFSQALDWTTSNAPPVVWPTNELLARRLGIKISTLKHHLAGLVEAGLICYSDHPTYQRRGRRGENGHIIEGYGINLSPIAARYRELLEISDSAEFEARECKRLSNRRTTLRREVAATIEAAQQQLGTLTPDWNEILSQLDQLRESRPQRSAEFASLVGALEDLRVDATALFETMQISQDFDTAVAKFRPPQGTAEIQHSESCSHTRHCPVEREIYDLSALSAQGDEERSSSHLTEVDWQMPKNRPDDDTVNISLPLLRCAFVELTKMAPEIFEHWTVFRSAGLFFCRLCYVHPHVYQEAIKALGPDLAVIAIGLTAERSARGSVANPGGYLRELAKRGRQGRLRLTCSLFGMALAKRQVSCTS